MIGMTFGCALACAVLVWAEYRGARDIRIVAKLAASAAFVTVIFLAIDGPAKDPAMTAYRQAIAIGILFGAIGDAALLGTTKRMFLLGLIAFLLGHLAYVAGIASILPAERGVPDAGWLAAPRMLVAGLASILVSQHWLTGAGWLAAIPVIAAGLVLASLWPRLGSMRIPVIGYVLTITVMVVAAIAAARGQALPEPNRCRLLVGACVFFASDIAVARDRFVAHRFTNKLWGLPAYYAGQLLFAWSVAGL
jgi:uncharacterized membrane protein YhhN